MSITKTELNSQLKSVEDNNTLKESLTTATTNAIETKYANKATLIGSKSGEVVAGIESLETKIDNAGTTPLGDAVCSFTGNVPGLGGAFDPTSATLDESIKEFTSSLSGLDSTSLDSSGAVEELFSNVEPIGGGVATAVSTIIQLITGLGSIAKFTEIGVGASAVDAIKQTATDVAAKSEALINDVQSASQSIEEATNLTELVNAVNQADIAGIVAGASSLASLNPSTLALTTLANFTGNENLTPPGIGSLSKIVSNVQDVVKKVEGGIDQVLAPITEVSNQISDFVSRTGIKTGFGLLQDISEDLTRAASSIINKLAFGTEFNDAELSSILGNAISGDPEQKATALKQIMKNTKSFSPEMRGIINSVSEKGSVNQFINEVKTKAEVAKVDPEEIEAFEKRAVFIEDELEKLDTTISGSIVRSSLEFYSEDVDLVELAERYKGSASEFSAFTYVESKEELLAEFAKANREITEVIVHATDTYTNANIGCEELHTYHNEQGFDGIQYHFVIRRDGRLQRGIPLDKVSEASNTRGHRPVCVDVALVGGVNAPSGTENPDQYRSAQSFTRIQMETLEALLAAFYSKYYGGQVFGHNDISIDHEDPYFDVIEYSRNLFRKRSVYTDLLTDNAYEPADLIQQRPV